MAAIAFFDFDETLIVGNSGQLWIRRELREGNITPTQFLRAAVWMFRYKLGWASMDDALRTAIGSLRGQSEQALRERTRAFYETEVRTLYRTGARPALERHRAQGDAIVLLTASSIYLSELVAEELGFDDVLCNRFEIDEAGAHTGRPVGNLCFGAGKLEYAEAYARQRGVSLSDCWFYTDSYSDLPVLERLGHPVVVNPDPRLRREAERRGWPVEWWGEALSGADPGASVFAGSQQGG
ncbi:MAG TPA: HAD family hydrolase [Myxococcaceae bacterium]|nr:HAD family hydrolase [Myxococcaceae bacterium]